MSEDEGAPGPTGDRVPDRERRVERPRRQERERALLDGVRSALEGELDLTAVCRTVVRAVADSFGYSLVSVYFLRGDALELQEQAGTSAVIAKIPAGTGVAGRVVRSGVPALVEDVRADPDFLGAIEGVTSEVCVPLRVRGRVAGVLNVESVGTKLTREDLTLLEALSLHLSAAIAAAGLRVLLVDDEAMNRKLLAMYLERLGHQIDCAEDGREALAMAGRARYDVLLMDMNMPVMDGLEAARRIRAELPRDSQPYIIAITGSAMAEDSRLCLDAGMDDYLAKPIRMADLSRALRKRAPAAPSAEPVVRPAPSEPPVFDRRVLDALLVQLGPGAEGSASELIEIFRQSGRALAADMAEAVRGGDAPRLRLAAHSLKSAAASVGAERLRVLCGKVEAEARSAPAPRDAADWAAWERQVGEAAAELGRAVSAISAWAPPSV